MLACALAALVSGCTYRVHNAGSDRFLHQEVPWAPGVTTAEEVAVALGPPDHIARWNDELIFVYRFRQATRSGFAVKFYLTLFSREAAERIDSTLVVGFDADDRLLYHGISR